jgi:hypothetical protein
MSEEKIYLDVDVAYVLVLGDVPWISFKISLCGIKA